MRPPDLTIGPSHDPQTLRWHLFRWRGVQVALHRWCRSDSDRALHDHSADNISVLLWGCYREHFNHAWEPARSRLRVPFVPYFRRAETPHRVQLFRKWADGMAYNNCPVWSVWIRFKPRREWGFYCPRGWRHWKEYVAERSYSAPGSFSTVGKGCDE